MPFFAIQYRVLFHDTMAYGSHHYMTNFKFQNMARETVLFESTVNGTNGWAAQLQDKFWTSLRRAFVVRR